MSNWREIDNDRDFAALFVGATIVAASGRCDAPDAPSADVYWKFSDGRWMAMKVTLGGGCPTCGDSADKTYWSYTP